jgi:ankyrin repeat protein
MLVDAGADVNAHDYNDETPISTAQFYPALLPVLVAAGANLESKAGGKTALIRHAFVENYVREMLAVGANPAAVADNGDTPLKVARQYQCPACAAMIEDALKQRGQPVPPAAVP